MILLREAYRELASQYAELSEEGSEYRLEQFINSMSNYDFLELLDSIFEDAVRKTPR